MAEDQNMVAKNVAWTCRLTTFGRSQARKNSIPGGKSQCAVTVGPLLEVQIKTTLLIN